LILENLGQRSAAAASLTGRLTAAPGLRILATRRAVLHIYGEHEFPVGPLPLPALRSQPRLEEVARSAAVALFVTRSRAVNPHFVLNQENAATVAEICVRLDGLPLTLELAAARSKLLSPAALLARLTGALGSRLTFLTDRNRSLAERHQTLRTTLTWSYDLLGSAEQLLLRRLAVFRGIFALEAAEAICGAQLDIDVLTGIEALVDNSLLDRVEIEPSGNLPADLAAEDLHFQILSIIREYALEQLGQGPESDALFRRYANYYLQLAEQAEAKLKGHEQVRWLRRLVQEHDNVRAALRWSLDEADAHELGLQLAAALGLFWVLEGALAEGYRWLTEALDKAAHAPAALRAKALYALASIVHAQGDLWQSPPIFQQSLGLYQRVGDQQGVADALYALGRLANRHEQLDEASALLTQSLALSRAIGDDYRITYTLTILAFVRLKQGQPAEAQAIYEEAQTVARANQDKAGLAFVLTGLGEFARQQDDYTHAAAYYNEGMELARELGQKARVVMLLHNLAYVALQRDDPTRSAALFRESLRLGMELPDRENYGMCLVGLGCAAVASGALQDALYLFGAGLQILETLRARLAPADQREYDRAATHARTQLESAQFEAWLLKGRALTAEQLESFALTGRLPGG